eukprot:gb/GECH01014458.1/.p1 GENE.gb/GECH01014458.1/~~gb/GECH01014458.1/.p1  ORF type:complete len:539 (+),score=114.73 gb/GECH01014458.1/:1-1617(+)
MVNENTKSSNSEDLETNKMTKASESMNPSIPTDAEADNFSEVKLYDDKTGAPLYDSSPDAQNDSNNTRVLTFDQAVEEAGFGWFQIKLLFLCGFVWMADSMEMMLLSLFLPVVKEEWDLEDWEEAFVTSVVFVGMLIGSSLWGKLCDHIGRRYTYLIVGVFTTLFGIASSFSPSYVWLLVSRGLVGFGIGGSHVAFSMFAEFLPVKKRGTYMIAIEYFWTIGAILEAGMAWAILPTIGWRWLLGLSALPLILTLAWYPILPESPHFLLVSGKNQKAWETVRKAAMQNKKSNFPFQGRLVENEEETGNVKRGKLMDLLGSKAMAYLSVLLWFIWFFNMFLYYGIVFFTPQYFESGNDENSKYLAVLITSIAEVPGLFVSALVINYLGRKLTLCILFVIGSIFTILLAIPHLNTVAGTIFAVFSRAAIMGAFSTTYVYTPEVYPTTIRSTALGIALGVSRVAGIATPYVSDVLQNIGGNDTTWLPLSIYGLSGLISAIAAMLLPVETKGKTLPKAKERKITSYSQVKEQEEAEVTIDSTP